MWAMVMVSTVHRIMRPLGRLHPRRLWATWRWLIGTLAAVRARRAEPRLTVAVDVTALWEPLTGVGWYVYQLLHHLAERDDVRLRLYGLTLVPTDDVSEPVVDLPRGSALEPVAYHVPDELSIPPGWVIRMMRRLEPLLIALDANEVLFAPNYFLPRRYLLARGALVATVLDLTVRVAPWTMRKETVDELGRYLESTVFRASRLLTISESVRKEMIAHGLGSPGTVHAVHLGPGQLATVESGELPEGIPDRYALFVGTIEPRKNLQVLLEAWERMASDGGEPPLLVVCGRYGWKSGTIRRQLAAAERSGWVRHLGYVAERQLAALYRQCLFLCFPSLYEGFGLPAVEAMHVGVPMLLSDIPVLREIGGEAALYAPPDAPLVWVDQVERLAADDALRSVLSDRGTQRLEMFDWSDTARGTLDVLRQAAGREAEP